MPKKKKDNKRSAKRNCTLTKIMVIRHYKVICKTYSNGQWPLGTFTPTKHSVLEIKFFFNYQTGKDIIKLTKSTMARSERGGHAQNIQVEGEVVTAFLIWHCHTQIKNMNMLCANNPTYRNLLPTSKTCTHQSICGNHVYHKIVYHVNIASGLNVHQHGIALYWHSSTE